MSPTTTPLSVKRSLTRTEDESITLKEKACRPVCRRRQWVIIERGKPVVNRNKIHESSYEIQRQNSENEQIWTLLDRQREQSLADCQAEIRKHEFQADYDRGTIESQQEEICRALQGDERRRQDYQLLHEQLLKQNWDLRNAHEKSLNEVEELKKFQGSTFDTITRRRIVEDQDTILELTGKIQELQNEINCMSDSKEFQDAESIRSGNSHVTSRPMSFPLHPSPEGMLSRSFGVPSNKDWAAKHLGHAWKIGKRFCRSSCVFNSTLSAGIESMEFRHFRTDSLINAEKNENQTPVQDQRCQSGPSAKKPTTTADFGSSFRQILLTATFACWKIRFKDRGLYLFTISYGSYSLDQRSGDGWFSGWF